MLSLIFITLALDAVLFQIKPIWAFRRYVILLYVCLVSFITGWSIANELTTINMLILVVSIFRLMNYARIAMGRMHPEYLLKSARSTGLMLGGLQALLVVVSLLDVTPYLSHMLGAVAWSQLGVALLLAAITIRNIIKTKHQPQNEFYSDKELPTVSVLIPARNETTDLENCLHSLLASDYQKLEIIVLDDCSHLRTSEIIRGFAQKGVRFIKGAEPNDHWLAKNQAYERLRQEASGELLLFCGVDVRFGSRSVRSLVTTLMNRDKDMVSVMPRRFVSTPLAAFIQPMRYWWELSLPRRFFNMPPVLSTCWLIKADSLEQLGGFKAVMRAIIPELYFAREIIKKRDGYSFVRSDDVLDIQTVKNVGEQRATAVRTRYPQLKKRPENVLALSFAEFVFLLGPFILLLVNYTLTVDLPALPLITACLLLVFTHITIVGASNPSNVPVALFNFPLVVLGELYLLYESMIKYEFSVVTWKDRNICVPVMHVEKSLPRI